ncbi:MAG TPA: T9SS type A sorting domain-containing protein, partial [Chitinophagales bacterium]|nr:T9SS type A sorting domain-containing protein [Chitinophagales bacterium]
PESGYPLKVLWVPAFSFGYVKVPIEAYYPPERVSGSINYSVNLYPNPASNQVRLQAQCLQEDCEILNFMSIEVVNILGETTIKTTITNNGSLNISALPNGIYKILVKFDDGSTVVKQLVKQ